VIALDYGMRGGEGKMRVRRAFLCYRLKRRGPDIDPAARKSKGPQFVLLDREPALAKIAERQNGEAWA
jgi:hypothetical protein